MIRLYALLTLCALCTLFGPKLDLWYAHLSYWQRAWVSFLTFWLIVAVLAFVFLTLFAGITLIIGETP